LASSLERVSRYQTNLLSEARKAAKAAQFAYSQGALDVTSLLDARRTLRAIEFDAANAYADYAKSLAVWQVVQTYLPTTAPDADAATQE
jgi:cobalt-zinc-cadmium efflux system outer membrane protein